MLNLNTEIIKITGVGQTIAKRLEKIGLKNLEDLLYYFPFRYDDFSKKTKISELKANSQANIAGQIELIQNKRSARKHINITEAIVSDDTEQIKIIWFNQPFIAKILKPGDNISLAGKIEHDFSGFVMKSPIYEKIILGQTIHTQGIIPNYHLIANITQKQIRFLIAKAIKQSERPEDWLPENIIKNQKLLSLPEAIEKIHFPKNQADIDKAKKRLAFNELFLIQLQSQSIKQELKSAQSTKLKFKEEEIKNFVASLPFQLTNSQKKSAWEILRDLKKRTPMARMLEGDVGSGKTIVAVMALLTASLNKTQSVLMAPTEILAKQHFTSISGLLAKQNINICLLTNREQKTNFSFPKEKSKAKNKQKIFELIKTGEINIIIGTHALIQEKLEFNNLSLAIIDEQHRFGVEQRKILLEKSRNNKNGKNQPHLLSMTATPIPRSLALTIYGDLNISIINEMPPGRKTIITRVVAENNREKAYAFIKKLVSKKQQVFVVCPLIDVSDKLGVKSVKEEYEKLDKKIFPNLKIGLLHGRVKPKEKDKIMADFLANKINILVSTSVVEVGVDIPNASVMMIEGADRFGLAQLHQFRGRVGRGKHQSYCLLFTDSESPKTLNRLSAMAKYTDGFSLAEIDLRHRGPGEVYGTAQKGFPELKIASLFDYKLIKAAKEEAENIFKNSGLNKFAKLKEKINLTDKMDYLKG
ncbi:MAG: ATP-dependent DNA helicase RecG [Patescibacteria group bacterium]|nr:ATP-dependent DNA helicase RecG [Patescibacteria group bacterium]